MRPFVLRFAALLALWALGACSTPPPAAPLTFVELPPRWQGQPVQTATRLAQWWLRFDDATLGALVEAALDANPSIAAGRAALRQARATRDGAAANLFPTVQGALSAQRGWVDAQASNSFQAGLDASWELDLFGGQRAAVAQGDAAASASAASLGDVQVSVAAEVALHYIALRSAQERLEIARHNLTAQLDTLQITEWRMQAGLVTALEAAQSRAALEQVRAALPPLQLGIAQSSHALATLTGQPPDALTQSLATTAPVPQPATDLALSFPAETLRQRADVRAAEYRVNATFAAVGQADAARLPSLNLGGSLGLKALTLAGMADGATLLGTLLARVAWPLWDGGAGSARQRAQQAALEQVQANYTASVLQALLEVENALVALRTDRLRLTSLRLAAEAASQAAQMANQRYQSGLVDFQTVLDTQRTRLATQDSVASASATVSADHVRLYKALGGGWLSDNRATL